MKIPGHIRLTLGLLFFVVMFINLGISAYWAFREVRRPYDGWFAKRRDDSRWELNDKE